MVTRQRFLAILLLVVAASAPCLAASEILACQFRGIGASTFTGIINSGQMSGQAKDAGNPATTIGVKIVIDDPSFAATGVTISGLSANGTTNFLYDATQTLDGINPQDGAQHIYYLKALSNVSSANDVPCVGAGYPATVSSGIDQGFPYKFTAGAVAPLYAPVTMTAGSRLTAAKLGIIFNPNDTYSIGTNTGGATLICAAATCGTDLWSNGVAGKEIQAHGVPADAIHTCPAAVTVTQNIGFASTGPIDTCRAQFAAAGGAIQHIAIAWVRPSLVVGATYAMGITGYVSAGSFPSALVGTNYFCPSTGQALGYSQANPFFNKISGTPFTDTGLFPTMMLVGESNQNGSDTFTGPWAADAPTFATMVDQAVAAQDTNPSTGVVYSMYSNDNNRNLQALITPVTATLTNATYTRLGTNGSPITSTALTFTNALIFANAFATVGNTSSFSFITGAGLWWPITSTAGILPYDGNQTPIAYVLRANAVAAYGNAVEPCGATAMKFPDPILTQSLYQQGATALQAMIASIKVSYFGGNFAGDPLAAPFTQPSSSTGGSAFGGKIAFGGKFTQ